MNRTLKQLFWFSVSGLIGFLVDTLILYILLAQFGPYVARLFSFLSAVITTWQINKKLTFNNKTSGLSTWHEFFFYLCLMLFGGSFNYGTYAILISQYDLINAHPIIGVAAGSLMGLLINFFTSKTILYRLPPAKGKSCKTPNAVC